MPPDPSPEVDPASTRLAHLREESDIKSVGQFCYFVAAFGALGTLEFALFATGVIPPGGPFDRLATPDQVRAIFWALAVLMAFNTIGQAVLGHGLTHLRGWARWTVVALTGLSLVSTVGLGLGLCFVRPAWGLPGLAIGVGLHAMILHPLLKPGAGVVFSPEYGRVIRETPQIRSRMHVVLKLAIGLILAGVACLAAYLAGIYWRVID